MSNRARRYSRRYRRPSSLAVDDLCMACEVLETIHRQTCPECKSEATSSENVERPDPGRSDLSDHVPQPGSDQCTER